MHSLPTLKQLRYLVALHEHRHFGRAAEACHVSVSTLSAGIGELEATLGIVLMERQNRRRVVFSPLAEEIVSKARLVLSEAHGIVEKARSGSKPLGGDVRLGVIPTIGPYMLADLNLDLRKKYPDLKLYLREETSARLLERLNDGRLDVVLIALPYQTGDLITLELAREPLVVAMPQAHRLAVFPALSYDQLEKETFLNLEDGHYLRNHTMQACRLVAARSNETMQATSLSTLVHMVGNGAGLGFLPLLAAGMEQRAEPLIVVRPLNDQKTARTLALAWRPGSPRSAEFRMLGEAARSVIEKILARSHASLASGKPGPETNQKQGQKQGSLSL